VRRLEKRRSGLLHAYVWGRQTLAQLATRTGHSARWVRREIAHAISTHTPWVPQPTVIAADVTFWGRHDGVCVFRSPTLKRNLWWKEVTEETPRVYEEGLRALQAAGWTVTGAVIDGKRGVARVFEGIPVQMCQFHQVKIVTRYLTQKPKTQAGIELRALALRLVKSTETEFLLLLKSWQSQWKSFLDERTSCSRCRPKLGPYTHRKLRAAYRSLITHFPLLFTYQTHQDLQIPNTTNTLDGMFSQIKNRLGVHRGAKKAFRYKLINEILSGSN